MVEKAEKAVDSAEAVGNVIKNVVGPVGVLRVARMVFHMVSRNKQK